MFLPFDPRQLESSALQKRTLNPLQKPKKHTFHQKSSNVQKVCKPSSGINDCSGLIDSCVRSLIRLFVSLLLFPVRSIADPLGQRAARQMHLRHVDHLGMGRSSWSTLVHPGPFATRRMAGTVGQPREVSWCHDPQHPTTISTDQPLFLEIISTGHTQVGFHLRGGLESLGGEEGRVFRRRCAAHLIGQASDDEVAVEASRLEVPSDVKEAGFGEALKLDGFRSFSKWCDLSVGYGFRMFQILLHSVFISVFNKKLLYNFGCTQG